MSEYRIHEGRTVRVVLSDTMSVDTDPAALPPGTTVTVVANKTQGTGSFGTIVQDPLLPCVAYFTAGDRNTAGRIDWTVTEPGEAAELVRSDRIAVIRAVSRRTKLQVVVDSIH